MISKCLRENEQFKSEDNEELLSLRIKLAQSFTNSHLFLLQFFEKYFSFLPTFVFYNDHYVLYFLPKSKNQLIQAKFSKKLTAFRKKYTKQVYFIDYEEPITLTELIQNLFQHTPFYFIECEIDDSEKLIISIRIYLRQNLVKFALGRNGNYIKSINEFLQTYLDKRIWIFIRSIDI